MASAVQTPEQFGSGSSPFPLIKTDQYRPG